MSKSTQTRKDKSDGKCTKPTYILPLLWKDVGMDEALYILYLVSLLDPPLFVYFLARHSYMYISFLFLVLIKITFVLHICSNFLTATKSEEFI